MRTLLATLVALLLGTSTGWAQCTQKDLEHIHNDIQGGYCAPGYGCGWSWTATDCRTGNAGVTGGYGTCTTEGHMQEPTSPPETGCTMSGATSCTTEADDCDGIDNDGDGVVDEGCQSSACEDEDRDTTPIYFASGLVRTREVTDFQLPGQDGLMEFRRTWLRADPSRPAYTGEGIAGPRSYVWQTTSIGHGWRTSWQDVVLLPSTTISPTTKPLWISWKAENSFKFSPISYVAGGTPYWLYRTTDGKHELQYYGDVSGAPDARIVRVQDGRIWEFSLRSDLYPMGTEGIALLDRIAQPAESVTFTGGASVTVARDAQGKISTLTDAEGRVLTFEYEAGALVKEIKLGSEILVRFVYFPEGTPGTQGKPGREFLERVETGFTGTTAANYIRYVYADIPTVYNGVYYYRLIAKVVLRGTASTPAAVGATTVQPGEIAQENHEFLPGGKAKRGRSLEQDFAYEYGTNVTKQFDLRRPQLNSGAKVACTSSSQCGSGYGCWVTYYVVGGDGFCYRQKTINLHSTILATAQTSGVCLGCGGGRIYYGIGSGWRTKRKTNPQGMKTSYSWDTRGRPLCIVTNDNNDEAGSPPCEAPAGARVQWFAYSGDHPTCNSSTTEKVKSVISGASPNERAITTTRNCGGRVATKTITGWTRNLSGAAVQQTRTTSYAYDSMGRLTQEDGPLANTAAYDVVDYAYYGATGDASAHRLHTVTRYVGTSATCPGAGCTALITTYANYDKFGTPRSVIDAAGVEVTRVTDGAGRVTEERVESAVADEVTTAVYNPDGTVRKVIDADGVCHTFDYNADGLVIARRRTGQASPLCGAVPITTSTGEVETYTYDITFPSKISTVERLQDGVVSYRKRYTYDEKGLLAALPSAIDDTKSRRFTYGVGELLTLDERENCYAGSTTCTKDALGWDILRRPSSWGRTVTDTTSAVAGFQYMGPQGMTPSTVTTGDGTTTATTTTYVYDDFGQLVEYGSPDGGTTRLVYDLGGRLITRREERRSPTRNTSMTSVRRRRRPGSRVGRIRPEGPRSRG